ncbi:hypothetical protein HDU76_014114 [Blyttiomyces sp. JEL0837]|nr:hypothetical protein HDU76_014114 [Blyttiomyces sp. JEL0837]
MIRFNSQDGIGNGLALDETLMQTDPYDSIHATTTTTLATDTGESNPDLESLIPLFDSFQSGNLTEREIHENATNLWKIVFHLDYQGDLTQLPWFGIPNVTNGLYLIKSRSMFEKLCILRPDLCNMDAFRVYFKNDTRFGAFVSTRCGGGSSGGSQSVTTHAIRFVETEDETEDGGSPLCFAVDNPYKVTEMHYTDLTLFSSMKSNLLHVALRNGWWDYLGADFWEANPVACGRLLVTFGHVVAMKRLVVDLNAVNPGRYEECVRDPAVGALTVAAFHGHVGMVRFLYSHGCNIHASVMMEALREGHLGVLDFIVESAKFGDKVAQDCISRLKEFPVFFNLKETAWRYANGFIVRDVGKVRNILGGLEVVLFLKLKGVNLNDFHSTCFKTAIENGDFELLDFLMANQTLAPTQKDVEEYRSEGAFMALTKFYQTQFPTSPSFLTVNGLRFRHEVLRTPCTKETMDTAAARGLLDSVKYLHEHCRCRDGGCTVNALDNAAANNHFDVVKFLLWNRGEGCTSAAIDYAATAGHYEIVRYLHEFNYGGRVINCTKVAMHGAAANGHFDIVEFLHKNRTEGCDTHAMDLAAGNGCLRIVRFLAENRKEGCTQNAIVFACRGGRKKAGGVRYGSNLKVLRELYERYKTKFEMMDLVRQLKDFEKPVQSILTELSPWGRMDLDYGVNVDATAMEGANNQSRTVPESTTQTKSLQTLITQLTQLHPNLRNILKQQPGSSRNVNPLYDVLMKTADASLAVHQATNKFMEDLKSKNDRFSRYDFDIPEFTAVVEYPDVAEGQEGETGYRTSSTVAGVPRLQDKNYLTVPRKGSKLPRKSDE